VQFGPAASSAAKEFAFKRAPVSQGTSQNVLSGPAVRVSLRAALPSPYLKGISDEQSQR